MATANKPTTIRINDSLKSQANDILESIGLSYNSFVVMATRQLVNQRKIPFEIIPTPQTPTEETRKALVAAEAKELGLIPDDAIVFSDADELMAFLDKA